MNVGSVQVLEFYPLEKDDTRATLSGTIRIRLIDLEIEILGIHVSKQQDRWYFNLPSRKGTHHDTGKPVRYPNIVFTDREKHRQFVNTIRERGRAFIEQQLSNTEKPLIFPMKLRQASELATTLEMQNRPTASKETAFIDKPKTTPSIAAKEWRDPPPRIQARSISKFGRK